MSKNLTRKGLAFGALVALGTSVFAGTPAFAADTVVLAANYTADATLAVPITETIALNASLAPGSVAANISQLKYKIVTDGTFVLSVAAGTGNSTIVTNSAQATAYTNNDAATPTTTQSGVTTGVFGTNGTVRTTSYVALSTPASATAVNTLTLGVNAVPDASVATTGVAPTSASATRTATVTAFLDSNSNGVLDTGEISQSQDVKFVKYSEITSTTTITAPTAGDTTATALVKFTNINNQAIAQAKVGAYFTKGDGTSLVAADGPIAIASGATNTLSTGVNTVVTGTQAWSGTPVVVVAGLTPTTLNGTYTTTAVTSTSVSYTNATATGTTSTAGTVKRINANVVQYNVAYSTTKGGFSFTTGTVDALAKSSAVKVQPLFKASSLGVADFASSVGTAQTASVATRALGSFLGEHVVSTTAKNDGAAPTTTAPASGTVTNIVALNSEKQVYFLAKDTSTPAVALAGQAVVVTVSTSATLSSTVTLTVNGTTYTSNAALPGTGTVAKLALTTGSDGKAIVTYKTAGYTTGTVTIVGADENSTATVIGTETARDFTGNTSYIDSNEGNTAVTTDGTAVAVLVYVQDQFGGAATDGTYQVTATWQTSSQATTASTIASSTYAAVVGGKATLSILDNGTGLGTNTYLIELRPVAANGVLGAADRTIASPFTIKIVSAADAAAGAVTVVNANGVAATYTATTDIYSVASGTVGDTSTHAIDLTYSAYSNVDTRKIAVTAPAPKKLDATDSTTVAVTGSVASASTATYGGVAVPSAVVTVSGTGMYFAVAQDNGTVWGDGTVTFEAAADGTFSFNIYSHIAGKNTITIKSGTGTATLVAYFKAASVGAASTLTAVVSDGSSQFQAGRALDVTFKVVDKFGNPVQTTAVDATTVNNGQLTIGQTGSGYLATSGLVRTGADGTYTTKLITNAGDLGTSTITATLDMGTIDGGAYNASTNPYLADLTKSVSSEFGITDADVTVGGRAIYASAEYAKGKTVTVSVDGVRLYSKLQTTDNYTELKFTQKKAGKHVVTVFVSGGLVHTETVVTTK